MIAITNLFGEFSDLQAGQLLDESLDPLALVDTITSRYRDLWAELTGVEEFDAEEMWSAFEMLGLLTSKSVLYVCNVEEASADLGNAFTARVFERAKQEGARAVVVSAKIESEIAVLPLAEQADYLEAIGLPEPGLNRVTPTRMGRATMESWVARSEA